MVDDGEPEAESDLRRRAAWLLGMLAIVAVLFVVVITAIVHTGSGGGSSHTTGSLDGAVTSPHQTPTTQQSGAMTPSTQATPRTGSNSSSSPSGPATGLRSCPTQQTCILDGDIGDGIDAINQYRTQHGKPAVPGAVTEQAQTCAVRNGNGCHGGWAETEVPRPDGQAAVHKILRFGKLLDPDLKNFEVGWAYDPSAKLYYFAIVRND